MDSKKDEREENSTQNNQKKAGGTKKTESKEKKGSKTKTDETKAGKKGSKTKLDETKTGKKDRKTKIDEIKAQTKATKANEPKVEKNIEENTEKVERNVGKNMGKRAASKPLRIIWNIFVKILTLIIIFISIVIVVQKVTNNQEAFLGFRIFRVQTGSMIPKYQIGDVILVREVNPDQIQIGDDVTYEGETGSMKGLLVTHRVIDIEEVDGKKVFHTKGIANNLEDPVVNEDQINGVVQTKMYILSLICVLLNNKYVFYFCGILPLTIYVAFRIFKGKKVKKIEREN